MNEHDTGVADPAIDLRENSDPIPNIYTHQDDPDPTLEKPSESGSGAIIILILINISPFILIFRYNGQHNCN